MAKSGGGGGRSPAGRIPPMKAAGPPPAVNTEKSQKSAPKQGRIKARLDRVSSKPAA